MKKTHLILALAFAISAFSVQSKAANYQYMKIAVDAIRVNDALYSLTSSGNNPRAEVYRLRVQGLLDDLSGENTGFRSDMLPVDLKVTDNNEEKVAEICRNLTATMKEIRDFVEIAKAQFDADQLYILRALLSSNPGDYYMGINPDFEFTLDTHPFRQSLEEIQLQDIGFEEVMADSDTALWNMGKYCPNLQSLVLFGAEINNTTLTKMNLHTITNLRVLDLAENELSEFPANFNQSNTLEFLSLERNAFEKLPDHISTWTNLKFLDLRQNKLAPEELNRIKAALPNTKILN